MNNRLLARAYDRRPDLSAPLPSRPIRVIQISDPHLFKNRDQRLLNVETDASLKGVVRHIQTHEKNIDLVLATGDVTQDGSAQGYERFIELTRPLGTTLRGLPGNHDLRESFHAVWGDLADPVTDMDGWRLVMLDSTIPGSSAGNIASNQLEILKKALDTAGGKHVLVAVHHNPVPIGSGWLDTMMIDNGHELMAVLKDFPNVRGLIWGHVHQEFDSVYNYGRKRSGTEPGNSQLRLMAAPATCVQFTPRSPAFSLDDVDPGYRRLELHGDGRIQTEVVRVPGLGIKPDTGSKGY